MIPMRGVVLKLASVFLFVVMASLVKAASEEVPPGEVVFFRALFAIPVIWVWILWNGSLRAGLHTDNPMGHVFRGVVGTAAMAMGFTGLAFLPLTEAKAIGYAAPLLVVLFAAMFLGETVRLVRLGAVALGLVGVLIILYPRLTLIESGETDLRQTIGALAALGSAVAAALAQVFVRKLVQSETVSSITFWFSVSASCFALVTIPFGWSMPSPSVFVMLVLTGMVGGVGQICLTSAYRHADASLIAPFDYASMIFALAIGYSFFGEVPTWSMMAGAVIIIAAGVLIIWRERRLGLKRGGARRTMTPQG